MKFCEDVIIKNFTTISRDKSNKGALKVGCLFEGEDLSMQQPFIWDSLCQKKEPDDEEVIIEQE